MTPLLKWAAQLGVLLLIASYVVRVLIGAYLEFFPPRPRAQPSARAARRITLMASPRSMTHT